MRMLSEPALTTLFLGRLERLVVQEALAATLEEQSMVNRAILSTYRDCYALGLADEAKRILLVRRVRPL